MPTPRWEEIWPSSADSSPRMMEKSVVLPAPFGPTRPIRSSRLTCNVASANSTRSAYDFRMPDKVNMNHEFNAQQPSAKDQILSFPLLPVDCNLNLKFLANLVSTL